MCNPKNLLGRCHADSSLLKHCRLIVAKSAKQSIFFSWARMTQPPKIPLPKNMKPPFNIHNAFRCRRRHGREVYTQIDHSPGWENVDVFTHGQKDMTDRLITGPASLHSHIAFSERLYSSFPSLKTHLVKNRQLVEPERQRGGCNGHGSLNHPKTQLISISWRGTVHRDPSRQSLKKLRSFYSIETETLSLLSPLKGSFLPPPPSLLSLSLSFSLFPHAGLFSVEESWTLTAPPP